MVRYHKIVGIQVIFHLEFMFTISIKGVGHCMIILCGIGSARADSQTLGSVILTEVDSAFLYTILLSKSHKKKCFLISGTRESVGLSHQKEKKKKNQNRARAELLHI